MGENGLTTVFIVSSKNFGKIDIFCLSDPLKGPLEAHLGKTPVFPENTKYPSKNQVFRILTVKYGIVDAFSTYISDTFYGMPLSSKTKKLPRFFRKNALNMTFWPKMVLFWQKRKISPKNVFFGFRSWNLAHSACFRHTFHMLLKKK